MKAIQPSAVADGAIPPSRSSNTLGSAKVVDWNTSELTAVVMNTIIDMRQSVAFRSSVRASSLSDFRRPASNLYAD